jgi:hypothetical protein
MQAFPYTSWHKCHVELVQFFIKTIPSGRRYVMKLLPSERRVEEIITGPESQYEAADKAAKLHNEELDRADRMRCGFCGGPTPCLRGD